MRLKRTGRPLFDTGRRGSSVRRSRKEGRKFSSRNGETGKGRERGESSGPKLGGVEYCFYCRR